MAPAQRLSRRLERHDRVGRCAVHRLPQRRFLSKLSDSRSHLTQFHRLHLRGEDKARAYFCVEVGGYVLKRDQGRAMKSFRAASADEADARRRFAKLTPRERNVVELIVAGKTTKEISRQLRVSPRTIDAHRRHIMAKIGARRVAELVRLAVLYLPQADSRADQG